MDYNFRFFPAIRYLGTFGNNWEKSLFQSLKRLATKQGGWPKWDGSKVQMNQGLGGVTPAKAKMSRKLCVNRKSANPGSIRASTSAA